MTTQKRVLRAIGVAVAAFLVVVVATYVRQVFIDGGQYVFALQEPLIAAIVGMVIGFLAPDAQQRKKNRDNLFK